MKLPPFSRAADWKISFNLKSIRLFRCRTSPRKAARLWQEDPLQHHPGEGIRYPFKGARKVSSPMKKLFFVRPIEGFFFDNLSRRGMGRNAVKFIKLSYTRPLQREIDPLCRAYYRAKVARLNVLLESILNLRGQFDPVTNEIFFVFPGNFSKSSLFKRREEIFRARRRKKS